MAFKLKTRKEAEEFFQRIMKSSDCAEVVLFHNQRDTVREIMAKVAKDAGRLLIEKDLTTVGPKDISFMKLENKLPSWMKIHVDKKHPGGYVLFLREFHEAPDQVQDDVLNILVKKEVEAIPLPAKIVIVVGVTDRDESAIGVGKAHAVEFYR